MRWEAATIRGRILRCHPEPAPWEGREGTTIVTDGIDAYNEVVRILQLDVDATNDSDVSRFNEAFDENAWIFFIDVDGVLHKSVLSQNLEKRASPPSWGTVGRCVSVIQEGESARVQLSFDLAGGPTRWIDFHDLLRITGVWKITNSSARIAASRSGQPLTLERTTL
jgi:hypothetical protein